MVIILDEQIQICPSSWGASGASLEGWTAPAAATGAVALRGSRSASTSGWRWWLGVRCCPTRLCS